MDKCPMNTEDAIIADDFIITLYNLLIIGHWTRIRYSDEIWGDTK